MTKDEARKEAILKLTQVLKLGYNQTALVYSGEVCAFCQAILKFDKDDMPLEEIGEFWSKTAQESVLAHPDCTPLGIEAIQEGKDPEWSMA